MNGQAKIPVSIAIRPILVDKVDALAKSCAKSRSEVIGRILETTIESLNRPDLAWVKIEKSHFQQLLKI